MTAELLDETTTTVEEVGAPGDPLADWALEVGQLVAVTDTLDGLHRGYVSTLSTYAVLVLTPDADTYTDLDRIPWDRVVAIADATVQTPHPAG